jgi:hypothetical protein
MMLPNIALPSSPAIGELPLWGGRAAARPCRTCREVKPLSGFLQHNGARDGHRLHCRDCLLTGRYQPYIEGPEERARRRARESQPKWQQSHRIALARQAERYPAKQQATRALQAAVKSGRIKKAEHCQVEGCSSSLFLEGHHWSYAPEHWLEVMWVCAAHHRRGHAQGFIVPAAGIPQHYGTIPERA